MGVEHSTKVPRLCPTGDFLMSAIDKAVFLDDETGYDKETLKSGEKKVTFFQVYLEK